MDQYGVDLYNIVIRTNPHQEDKGELIIKGDGKRKFRKALEMIIETLQHIGYNVCEGRSSRRKRRCLKLGIEGKNIDELEDDIYNVADGALVLVYM